LNKLQTEERDKAEKHLNAVIKFSDKAIKKERLETAKETKISNIALGILLKSLVKKGLIHSPSSGQYLLIEGGKVSNLELSKLKLKGQRKIVYDAIIKGTTTLTEVIDSTGIVRGSVSTAIRRLEAEGLIIHVRHGEYTLPKEDNSNEESGKSPEKSLHDLEDKTEYNFGERD